MADKMVSVRLSEIEARAADELVFRGRYRSRSHLLREALEALLLKEQLRKDVFHEIRKKRPRYRIQRPVNPPAVPEQTTEPLL